MIVTGCLVSFKIRIQALTIRIQASKIGIQAFKTVADTSRNIWGGGGGIFNMYAFGVRLRYANLSNIMLGISNSLFDILL